MTVLETGIFPCYVYVTGNSENISQSSAPVDRGDAAHAVDRGAVAVRGRCARRALRQGLAVESFYLRQSHHQTWEHHL